MMYFEIKMVNLISLQTFVVTKFYRFLHSKSSAPIIENSGASSCFGSNLVSIKDKAQLKNLGVPSVVRVTLIFNSMLSFGCGRMPDQ
mmetsp:Transcript_17917/g.27144  ORF Transcript_17917/g.27144 Transcript_17917/m.27144 type:complete len:87 (-) Transcript_17917:1901-2161(-)